MATQLDPRPPRRAELDLAVHRALRAGGDPALLDHLERLAHEAEVAAGETSQERLWLRGYRARAELLRLAGGVLSTQQLAARLGLHPATIARRAREGTWLGLRVGGRWYFPRCQFGTDGQPLPGLAELLQALPSSWDGWLRLDVLLTPLEALGGITPLEAARRGAPWLGQARACLRGFASDTFG